MTYFKKIDIIYLQTGGFEMNIFKKGKEKATEIKRENELLSEIEQFIEWCEKTEDVNARAVKSLIEKMGSWYEMRFTDGDINQEFPCMLNNSTSDRYFDDISSMKDFLQIATDEEKKNIIDAFGLVKWSDIFSTKQFINKLDYGEKQIFRPSFPDIVDITKEYKNFGMSHRTRDKHFQLSRKGQVLGDAEDFAPNLIPLLSGNIKDVYQRLLQSKYYSEEDLEDIKTAIEEYDKKVKVKNGVLNSVMYKLIMSDSFLIGPRRAFKFAQEFNLDIRVPFMYGLNSGPYGRREFINKGLALGLTKDTECYFNSYENGAYRTRLMTIEDILNDDFRIEDFRIEYAEYQSQKTELANRLVDLLQIQSEQAKKNNDLSQNLIEQYTQKYIIGTQPMYELNLEHYQKTKQRPRIDMLLWTYLVDHIELLTENRPEELGKFYYRNREIIDEGISTIIKDFELSSWDLAPFEGKAYKDTGKKEEDAHYNLVWGFFGRGIEMASWSLTYANEKNMADEIRKYDERLCQGQDTKEKPRILTKKIHFDELNRSKSNF